MMMQMEMFHQYSLQWARGLKKRKTLELDFEVPLLAIFEGVYAS